MRPDSPQPSALFVMRLNAGLWVVIGIWATVGIGCNVALAVQMNAPQAAPRGLTLLEASVMLALVFHLPALVAAWLMLRLRIVAGERGLEFRGAFATRFTAWRDLEDYELRASPQVATSRLTWICAGGKWRQISQFYAPLQALRARIQTEARWSRTQLWQFNIERDDALKEPKTYAYRDPTGGKMFGWVAVGLSLCVVLVSDGFGLWATTPGFRGDALEKWGRIATIFLPLLLAHYAIFRTRKRQNAPPIRADQNGLSLVDAPTPTHIAWDEITDYGIEDPKGAVTMPQYVVEGTGKRLFFQREITDFGELQALICALAINASSCEWLHRESTDKDILGGEPSLWPGGVAGVGRKIYHYRTRTLRALLFLGSSIVLICVVPLIVAFTSGNYANRLGDQIGVTLSMAIIGFVTGLGWLAFWRASIQTDENGVLHRNIWGERFLPWDEIEAFTFNGYFYALKGARATIRYGLVAAEQSLRAEIEARTGLKMNRTGRRTDDE